MSKALWFDAMEQRFHELLDEGMDEESAYELATEQAATVVQERLADMIDAERDRRKEAGL